MSRWDPSWPRSGPKQPAPAHGLKINKTGTTWWGQRWIEALERVLRGDAGRLARGKTYARAGRTHDLLVSDGKIRAKVTGSRSAPYEVSIELAQLSDVVWQRAIAGMASQAQFAAELLAGQMPLAIDDVFRDAGTSLFPEQRRDLVTACSCPDWGDPCKHVAATHYVLGEALDGDPFLLFELRGRSKARVLEGIRAARESGDFAGPEPAGLAEAAPGAVGVATITLRAIAADEYDRAPQALPALDFSFEAPATEAAVLRQLGAPAAWRGEGSPADRLAPLVRAAAEVARGIALGDALVQPESEPEPAASSPNSSAATQSPPRVRPKPKKKAAGARLEAKPGSRATSKPSPRKRSR